MNNFWKDKKIFITGHTGFKGSWLSLLMLSYGAKVFGYSLKNNQDRILFDNLKLNKSRNGLDFNLISFKEDILDLTTLRNKISEIQPDFIFHLAAQSLVRKGYEEPIETWQTNVMGSINLLESLREIKDNCNVLMITTDKVYKNREWLYGYRECDELGGNDPYSASKAAMEIAISSWQKSFGYQLPNINIAVARAGNVIGGGDWSKDRIIPDAIKSLKYNEKIPVRNPHSTRPWQHVLEPLFGYKLLAEKMYEYSLENNEGENPFATPFNFGPCLTSNKSVKELVETILKYWRGEWFSAQKNLSPKESLLLSLNSEKAFNSLGWTCIWGFEKTVKNTINWYKDFEMGKSSLDCCLRDLEEYIRDLDDYQNN